MTLLHAYVVYTHPRWGAAVGFVDNVMEAEMVVRDTRTDELFLLPRPSAPVRAQSLPSTTGYPACVVVVEGIENGEHRREEE